MTYEELLARLEARRALIVHFSHHAVTRPDLVYPTDLLQVLEDRKDWPLSCSVLTPGHRMTVVGSVGVVLMPRTVEDVLRVHHDDAGAYGEGGDSHSLGDPLSEASLDASIDGVAPGTYNEWRVRGSRPVGIFITDPANIEVRRKTTYEGPWGTEETTALVPIRLDDLRAHFPGRSVLTMAHDGPRRL